MTICVFPGTFNPIHIAHLKMAQFVLENYGFTKVIFIPSYIPPHKQIDSNLAAHRYNMVKLATEKKSGFEVSDIEYTSEGKSYTLITVKKIMKLYNIKGRLNFIIGTDAFKKIKTWYKADELKDLVHFIVFPRGEDNICPSDFEGYDYEIVNCEKLDISSTDLRKNHNDGTTTEVKEYIFENGLYD